MDPPTPPTSFVSQGLRGQRLFGWPFGGVVVLAFSNLFDSWGRAVERPRSNGKCSPEGCTFSGRGLAKRPPQGLKSIPEEAKMISWRPLESSWGAVGRQMAGKTARGAGAGRKRSLAALGAVLAALGALLGALWAILTRPGGPREASGASGEGLREAILVLFGWSCRRSRYKLKNLHVFINVGCCLDRVVALVFGSFLLAWPAPGEEADMDSSRKTVGFCGSQGIGAFLADTAKGNIF